MICHLFSGRLSRLSALLLSMLSGNSPATAADRPPNVVIIFADDQGYGDVGCFGARGFSTPQPRPDGGGRPAVHGLLRRPGGLRCVAGRAADRLLPEPHRHARRARARHEARHPRRTKCCRRTRQTARLRHRRSSASGTSGTTRSSCRRGTASTSTSACRTRTTCGRSTPKSADRFPDLPLIEGRQIVNPRITPRTRRSSPRGTPSGPCSSSSSSASGRSSCTWRTHAARAAVRLGQVRGQVGHGLYGDVIEEIDWASARSSRHCKRTRLDEQDARHLHVRQRPVADLRQPRRLGGAAARRQGNDLGRGRPRAVHHALAGQAFPPGRVCAEPAA